MIYLFRIKPKAIWYNISVSKTNWLIPNYIFYNVEKEGKNLQYKYYPSDGLKALSMSNHNLICSILPSTLHNLGAYIKIK